jgi:L-2-hydroxyglutarate oxidase
VSAQSVGIIGGGIVGLAIGRLLSLQRPGVRVVVLEKEDRLAAHQTGHNSGVVHAGLYYRPGSLKAELCSRGRLLLRDYCVERGLPYQECGKLVVAARTGELGRLDALEKTASANLVPGMRRVRGAEIADIEPHAAGLSALHSPATAITDFVAVAEAMTHDIPSSGGQVLLSTAATGMTRIGWIEVTTQAGDVVRARCGIRAQAVDRDGSLVDDFRITQANGVTCIRNALSPAATSSLAIADYVVSRLDWTS